MKKLVWNTQADQKGFSVQIAEQHPYFSEHRVLNNKVLPGVAYIELAILAVRKLYPNFTIASVEDGVWLLPIVATQELTNIDIRLTLIEESNHITYKIIQDTDVCGSGTIKQKIENYTGDFLDFDQGMAIANASEKRINHNNIYTAFSEMGIDYGSYFSGINYVDIYQNKAFSLIKNFDGTPFDFVNLLDSAFQSGMAISIGEHQESLMPFSFRTLCFHHNHALITGDKYYVITEKKSLFRTEITICDQDLQKLISVIDLGVKPSLLSKINS